MAQEVEQRTFRVQNAREEFHIHGVLLRGKLSQEISYSSQRFVVGLKRTVYVIFIVVHTKEIYSIRNFIQLGIRN